MRDVYRNTMYTDPPDEDDYKTAQQHCPRCGAFVSGKPVCRVMSIPTRWEFTSGGNIQDITVLEEGAEERWYSRCNKCGHEF